MLTVSLANNLSDATSFTRRNVWRDVEARGFGECRRNQCLMLEVGGDDDDGDDDDTRTQGGDGDYGPFEVQTGGDPHNDVVARLERCLDIVMDDPGVPTTPQFTPIESVSAWVAWSQGVAIA